MQLRTLHLLHSFTISPSTSMAFSPFLFAAMHFMLFLFPSSAEHNNITDLSALLAFKARVDPYNILSTNWSTNTSFCSWTGVSCSGRRQRVISLSIENLPLYGTISPYVANLSFLSYLNLTNNSLAGPIPDSLAQMPRLRSLTLNQNQLSGSIPPAIFNMSLLAALFLEDNNLSGALPSNGTLIHAMLPRIQNLSLSSNRLNGNIPSGVSQCYHLRVLSLYYNQFSGNIPSELGNLKRLRILYLQQNNLTGTIPSSWGNLTNLLELDVSNNIIHGGLPEELGALSNLQRLLFSDTYGITGPIPISLSNISSLRFLILPNNKLTGPIRLHFGSMPRLQTLFLQGNKLTGGLDFLGSLSSCRVLKFLDLWDNELEGSLPNTVGNLSRNLIEFIVYANHINGEIPVGLGNLSRLEALGLGENELVGMIPSEITKLENLQWVRLENNRIYGSIPPEFGRLRINRLYLHGNNLSGPIPDSLGNVSGLQHLKLSANTLSSGIPQSMWSLTGLLELNLSHNFLDGSLSSAIENIKSLDTFDISVNQIRGVIPSALKALQMVRYLDLSNNSFDGQIPQSFGDLINIEALNLSCNNLSGVIPDSLSNLRYLSSINLSFNKLEGKIPSSGAFLNLTISSLVGNAGLCGAPRLGFPPCSANAAPSNPSKRVHLLEYILPAIALAIVLVASISILLKVHMKRRKSAAPENTPSPNNYRFISYHELVRATENFSEANFLGKGSFGSVYKGCLDGGLLAAIKVLNLEVDGASRSFDIECSALHMVCHRNLVKIIGTCSNLDFRALILQFMPNGSLERWLYSHNNLNLLQRINIIIDVASALDYLHHHHSQVVLHCDLKPSNILLDEDMTALVSDFGIAKLLVGDTWSVTSASTPGTIGYIAPGT